MAMRLYYGSSTETSTTTTTTTTTSTTTSTTTTTTTTITTTSTTNNTSAEGGFSSSSTNECSTSSSSSGPGMEENLLQINVYFNSLNEETISADIVYPIMGSAFASAFGGVMSLYLGIPIAMLFELVEILLDLLGNFFNWTNGKPLGRKNLNF